MSRLTRLEAADVPAVVIGAGLAGTVAAIRLAERGVAVTVLHDRPGATYMHGGGWSIGRGCMAEHGLPVERLPEALAMATDGLGDLALEAGPFVLLDSDGARRRVDLAPASHAAGARLGERVGVVDLQPLGHRFSAMLDAGPAVPIEWPADSSGHDLFGRAYTAVAYRFDDAALTRLIDALRPAIADRNLSGLLLPPVLGIAGAEPRRAALAEALGLEVAESLCTVPSTAGLRLAAALTDWRDRRGIISRRARVEHLDLDASRIDLAGGETLTAGVIVIATGSHFTGGLATHGGRPYEPLAGLPMTRHLSLDPQLSTHNQKAEGPFFKTGVATDDRLRPIYPNRPAPYPRVFAAGVLLGGPDPLVDGCGSGQPLLTGFIAGDAAAQAALEGIR